MVVSFTKFSVEIPPLNGLARACLNGTGLSEQQHDEESDTLAQMHRLPGFLFRNHRKSQ